VVVLVEVNQDKVEPVEVVQEVIVHQDLVQVRYKEQRKILV
jgi:hypothetical protein